MFGLGNLMHVVRHKTRLTNGMLRPADEWTGRRRHDRGEDRCIGIIGQDGQPDWGRVKKGDGSYEHTKTNGVESLVTTLRHAGYDWM